MKAQTTSKQIVLEPAKRSTEVLEFEQRLRDRIIGQTEAVTQLVSVYQTFLAGMNVPGRPVGNIMLLGPTGSGKTHLVEAAAEILFGNRNSIIKIDCAEYQHSHEIAKLIGSPPGYVGHRETAPALSQETLDQFHSEHTRLSLVLFDEIEKASDALWQLLLGVLDKGTLTLGDNRKIDFSRSIVFLTSNLGATEMNRLVNGHIGFAPKPEAAQAEDTDRKIQRVAVDAAKRRFSPEFINRLDKIVVFRTLMREELRQVLDIELSDVQYRVFASQPDRVFAFAVTEKAREFLLDEGVDAQYGARHLKRAIERLLVNPLSNLISTRQVDLGDRVTVDVAADRIGLVFSKDIDPDKDAIDSAVEVAWHHAR